MLACFITTTKLRCHQIFKAEFLPVVLYSFHSFSKRLFGIYCIQGTMLDPKYTAPTPQKKSTFKEFIFC